MNTKLLATTLAVSLPLLFGGAYAQTTTTPESGHTRSGAAGAKTPNPTPAPGADTTTTTGTGATTTPATGSTSGTTAPESTGSAVPGTGSASTAPATDTPPNSKMPGASMGDSAASTEAITGWSAKDDFIGKSVFNENDEKIGDINDIVIASDGGNMYVLIGAGGFLGMGEKNVAVPFDRIQRMDDRIMLSGYSKEQLKALPEVRKER